VFVLRVGTRYDPEANAELEEASKADAELEAALENEEAAL
tara:strand:- start:398 stop:517 length:120 start_codon:yes stop_codon:yes gene_type:complete